MLIGDKTVLRPWSVDDLQVMQDVRNDVQLQRQLMALPRGNSIEQVKDWLATRTKTADELFFVIACKSSNQAVGFIQVIAMNTLHGVGRMGICVTPGCQGKGYGGEALRLLEDYLRDVLRLRKLTLEVLKENTIAIGLYAMNGYLDVGCLREHFHNGVGYSDVVIMEKFLRS